jgi:ElaB/YqjD/DUF883 family membrane-anchored ribosome-binding protein
MRFKSEIASSVELQKFLDDLKAVVRDGEALLKVGATGLRQRAEAGARSTDQLVRGHPYETVGLLFGVGLIVGLLASGAFGHSSGRENERDV